MSVIERSSIVLTTVARWRAARDRRSITVAIPPSLDLAEYHTRCGEIFLTVPTGVAKSFWLGSVQMRLSNLSG